MRHRGKWSVLSDGRPGRPLWIVMSPEGRVVQMFHRWDRAIRAAHEAAAR